MNHTNEMSYNFEFQTLFTFEHFKCHRELIMEKKFVYLQTIKIEKCLSFGCHVIQEIVCVHCTIWVNRVGVLEPPTHKYLFMKKISLFIFISCFWKSKIWHCQDYNEWFKGGIYSKAKWYWVVNISTFTEC